MHEDDGRYAVEELRFFGQVVAGAAHEWGNVLAVIHESAGLLEDLASLAGRGLPLDPERLASLAGAVTRQVRRGDGLLTHLRRFAHAADSPRRSVNLVEAVATMAGLAERLARQRGVGLAVVAGPPAAVGGDPYRLCRLLHLGLEYALDAAGSGGSLAIGTIEADRPAVAIAGLPEAVPDLPEALAVAAATCQAGLCPEPGRLVLAFAPCP